MFQEYICSILVVFQGKDTTDCLINENNSEIRGIDIIYFLKGILHLIQAKCGARINADSFIRGLITSEYAEKAFAVAYVNDDELKIIKLLKTIAIYFNNYVAINNKID
ncbi:hypothetical protein SCLAR_v1c09130 [Spiroplasma clarkii]|uniref:Uncharacterized protein n=2 Tax=Spiroplasma clarkii TaxID=2139 RepID=A0A2K8KL17_9MOLU|nr:hypothetical protein SCLAR_v1c09130 [Spiroplasma clarkii]